jgi:hypothetical protein
MDNNNVLTRSFSNFTDYLISQYGNLPTDVKSHGGNAYNVRQSGKGKGKGKAKAKEKTIRAKANLAKEKTVDLAATYIGTSTMTWHTNVNAQTTTR